MQESIERLNAQPRTEKPTFDNNLNTWFLLDKVRGEKTLPAFYQGGNSGLIASIDYLLLGTEHAELLEVSPLLIKFNHTQLSESLYKSILEERSGLFIQAKDDNILPHLQYLFSMQSDTEGAVYARYYDPIFWTALQLSLADQQKNIWGNLQKVHTLTPSSTTQQSYTVWFTPIQNTQNIYTKPEQPIRLTHEFSEVSENIQRYFMLCSACYNLQIKLPSERVSNALLNLKNIINAGIDQIHLLENLIAICIEQDNIIQEPAVQKILQAELLNYDKVEQLVSFYQGN